MAHFYATVTGRVTHGAFRPATKTGTKASGMVAHVRGWDVGVRLELSHVNGEDRIRVYATGGSNGDGGGELLAEFNGETWHDSKGDTLQIVKGRKL